MVILPSRYQVVLISAESASGLGNPPWKSAKRTRLTAHWMTLGPYADKVERATMRQAQGEVLRREAACPIPLNVSAKHSSNESA